MKLFELFVTDRRLTTDSDPPEPPIRGDGGGGGPRAGKYWVKGGKVIPVTIPQPTDQLTRPEGLVAIYDPEAFGLTQQNLLDFFSRSARELEYYKEFLADEGRGAWLGANSTSVIDLLLQHGWALVHLSVDMEDSREMHLFCAEKFAKLAIGAVAQHFPLMQLDELFISLVDSYQFRRMQTLSFGPEDASGFGGLFQAVMKWLGQGEVPASNYIYFVAPDIDDQIPRSLKPRPGRFPIGGGKYRTGYGLFFYYEPLMAHEVRMKAKSDMKIYRALYSILHHQMHLQTFDLGKRGVFLSSVYFAIQPNALQVWDGRNWQKAT